MKQVGLLFFVIFALVACQQEDGNSVNNGANTLSIITNDGKEHSFDVELALTLQDQARGLMHRTEMAEDAGMLFYFGNEAERGFWMKNTLIPLDMLFIKADGTIYHIHENAIPHDLTSIRSQGPVAAVLELNAGISAKLGLKAGNKVVHPFFNQNLAQ